MVLLGVVVYSIFGLEANLSQVQARLGIAKRTARKDSMIALLRFLDLPGLLTSAVTLDDLAFTPKSAEEHGVVVTQLRREDDPSDITSSGHSRLWERLVNLARQAQNKTLFVDPGDTTLD
ncbi:hypothetical protein IWQ61_004807 [Dispira simplex]|nr:hypothetical protein IWQ61_004807 [Dispira simplex]